MTEIAPIPGIDATPAPKKPIVFVVRNYIDAEQLKADLDYSLVDLTNAFLKQASLASHYGDLNGKATHQVNDIKLKIKIAQAKVYRNERDRCIDKGEKFTEPYLQNCVTAHPLVIALEKGLNEAKQVAASAAVAVEAFHQRKDMLKQLGQADLSERQGELRMMDQSARDQVLERARARVAADRKGSES